MSGASAGRSYPFPLVLCGVALGPFTFSLLTTAVLPLVPQLVTHFDTTIGSANLVVTMAFLSGAVATPLLGRLGDLFGKRRMLVVALTFAAVGCLLAATTDSLLLLLIARFIQGPGTASIPLGIAVAADLAPPERTRFAIGFLAMSFPLGAVAGFAVGGAVTDVFGNVHAVFWLLAVLSLLAIAVLLWLVPARPAVATGGVDVLGAVLLTAGLLGVLLALSEAGAWGWIAAPTVLSFVAGLVFLGAWVLVGLRSANPLVDIRTFVRPAVLTANLASMATGAAQFVILGAVSAIAQSDPAVAGYGLGLGVFAASLILVPGMASQSLGAVWSSRLMGRHPASLVLAHSLVGVGAVLLAASFWNSSAVALVVVCAVGFPAFGASAASAAVHIVGVVDTSERGVATGMNILLRMIGNAVGLAGMSAIVAAVTPTGSGPPPERGYELALRLFGVLAIASSIPLLRRRASIRPRATEPSSSQA